MLAISRTRTPLFLAGELDDEPTQPIPLETMRDLVYGNTSDGVPVAIEHDARTEPVYPR